MLIHKEHFLLLTRSPDFAIFKSKGGRAFFNNEKCPYSTEHVLTFTGSKDIIFNIICKIMDLERNNLLDVNIPYITTNYNQGHASFSNFYSAQREIPV